MFWARLAGALTGEILYYPWGQVWETAGNAYPGTVYQHFASMQLYDTSPEGYQTRFRYFLPTQGRWLGD